MNDSAGARQGTNRLLLAAAVLTLGIGQAIGQQTDVLRVAGLDIEVAGELGKFSVETQVQTIAAGLEILRIKLSRQAPAEPPEFSLRWSLPSHNVLGYWSTRSYFNKTINADWWPSQVVSMLARDAPVFSLTGHDNQNRLTYAVSDALNTIKLSAGIREEDGRIYGQIDFFTEKHKQLTDYEVFVRFDRREIKYYQALADVASWWAVDPAYKPVHVPEYARQPMYSTWYSYHQNVSADALLAEAKIAKSLGYQSIIVDDGWQTLDSNRGYAFTGDWEPERIPRMKAFVDGIHELGMRFILWYSVPLVGEKSKVFKRFKGKYLRYWEGQGAYELDPRYPEVRAHIIETYRKALLDWGVDGFKLDFIGRFVANPATELVADDGRDYASVNEATDQLMTEIMKQLQIDNPQVMVEFRQPYIGPLMRKYGNMFRAGDAPNSSLANRVRTTDLRLLSGNTAVHSDMIMWHYDEPVEIAALQFLNILFSVPQISVRLAEIPEDHFRMVSFYTRYWMQNRGVLLDGDFAALWPQSNYPMLMAGSQDKRIVALYGDMVLHLDETAAMDMDIINAKASASVILEMSNQIGSYFYGIFDCLGDPVQTGELRLEKGTQSFSVPVSGMLSLQKLD